MHTAKEEISYYGKFEELQYELDVRFMRCHNSYIVNITKVKGISNRKFIFDIDKAVPISKTYYAEVKEAFLNYLDKSINDDTPEED